MKKLFGVLVFSLLALNVANAKEVNLSCELSNFFTREYALEDDKQIPLSQLDSDYLEKKTIVFDIEREKFLGSNLILKYEYESVLFTEEVIYFKTKGFKNNKNSLFWDTRLNRITGELTRVTRATESYVKERLKMTDARTYLGWKQTEIYQCKVVDKLF